MAFNQEKWLDTLAKNLYADNDWYRIGKNWSGFVNNSIVHIPQATAGIAPVKVVEGTSLPLATTKRTYSDKTFPISMLAAAPRFVSNITMSEASFDTRSAEMEDMTEFLRQAIDIEVMNGYSPVSAALAGGSIIRTSGTSTRANIYGQAAMKSLTFADILAAKAQLIRNTKNVKQNALYLIVDAIMYNDLIVLPEFDNSDVLTMQTKVDGFVGKIAGINVIQRSMGNPYLTTAALVQPTLNYADSYDATHFSGALLVDASKIGYALGTKENGEIKVGFENYATGYYNDVLQAHTRVGSDSLYAPDANDVIIGVIAIVETA